MPQSNPTALTNATRFKPYTQRAHSRSPSRSPARKTHFTAQNLDPLLKNLSPDSTLRALQATNTVPSGSQNALTQSITDASPSERELGIRAAFAAQKLREWKNEISRWPWPNRRERGFGLGLLPPTAQDPTFTGNENEVYLGYLPLRLVEVYEERIDEIRDTLETLKIEEIKDHVLDAHDSTKSISNPANKDVRPNATRNSYGRMRDFTALVTATIIQALPDQANLDNLLETWDVRIQVLRRLPRMQDDLASARLGLQAAVSSINDPQIKSFITQDDVDSTKSLLGKKISDVGSSIDRLLDMLEGYEDALPQTWIDSIEKIELDYATWVVEAEKVARRNELDNTTQAENQTGATENHAPANIAIDRQNSTRALPQELESNTDVITGSKKEEAGENSTHSRPSSIRWLQPVAEPAQPSSHLTLNLQPTSSHKRDKSQVSNAESAYSMLSDYSNAEIETATSTQVLASPTVSLVNNPTQPDRDNSDPSNPALPESSPKNRPPILQRASTASIEHVPKEMVKRITMRRSLSSDLLLQMSKSRENNTLKPSGQEIGSEGTSDSQIRQDNSFTAPKFAFPSNSEASTPPSPSLFVKPLKIRTTSLDIKDSQSNNFNRKPSQRDYFGTNTLISPVSPLEPDDILPTPIYTNRSETPANRNTGTSFSPSRSPNQSLENKIQHILTSLPTRIRLAKDGETLESSRPSSTTFMRGSTVAPSLILSPAKRDSSNRQSPSTENDVRIYHLARAGQSRDVPPIKLFVRAVGENGERVMVRVGGGWADLGEYLREYSAHHGRHTTSQGQLEVANFPSSQKGSGYNKAPGNVVQSNPMSKNQGDDRSSLSPSYQTQVGQLPDLNGVNSKAQRNRQSLPPGSGTGPSNVGYPTKPNLSDTTSSTQHPTITTTTEGDVTATTITHHDQNNNYRDSDRGVDVNRPTTTRSVTGDGSEVTTTTTVIASPTPNNSKYTPLGAAGPKMNGRRAVSNGPTSNGSNEAWVQDMIGKARAVSGPNTNSYNSVHGPISTTTTITSASSGRRKSGVPLVNTTVTGGTSSPVTPSAKVPSPANSSPATPSPAGVSPQSSTRSKLSKTSPSETKSKNRMSLGDVSGIKRVFLRNKSEIKNK